MLEASFEVRAFLDCLFSAISTFCTYSVCDKAWVLTRQALYQNMNA